VTDAAGDSSTGSKSGRGIPWGLVDPIVLCALKLAIGLYTIRQGFSHVSDDDYARTVIAERFAYAPRLDPSGTSWLPLPFWITGTAMLATGRSLATARAAALALGAASIAAPYAAMRTVGTRRTVAIAATAIAMALPWNAWLGAATVPEAWAAALVAAGAIAMASDDAAARTWAAAALFASSLSRYEAWPVCALVGAGCAWRAIRAPRTRREIACAVLASAGPLAWMAWNAYAHGSPLHFVARVSAFRQAIGAAALPPKDKLLGYPQALVNQTPEAAALGLVGALALAFDPVLRRRWAWAAVAASAVLAFLVVGDLRDGAPTHHPARALAPLWWVLVGMGVDGATAMAIRAAGTPGRRATTVAVGVAAAMGWCASLPLRWRAAPGLGPLEQRGAQIARGLEMRARDASGAEITPCEFEHFALIAAWGEPERAVVKERTHRPPTNECPGVVEPRAKETRLE
jgi:hypothetical protein